MTSPSRADSAEVDTTSQTAFTEQSRKSIQTDYFIWCSFNSALNSTEISGEQLVYFPIHCDKCLTTPRGLLLVLTVYVPDSNTAPLESAGLASQSEGYHWNRNAYLFNRKPALSQPCSARERARCQQRVTNRISIKNLRDTI